MAAYNKKIVEVAVGIILNANNEVLIARRDQAAHLGELWEFPGGKLEPGESIYEALCRELQEEVAINVVTAKPLLSTYHDFPELDVTLHAWMVYEYTGIPKGNEGQPIQWVQQRRLHTFEMPVSSQPILNKLK